MKKLILFMMMISLGCLADSQGKRTDKLDIIRCLPAMKAIPGGIFLMGTDSFLHAAEQRAAPAHQVELSSFFMADTLVTQRLWDLFIQDTGYRGYSYYHGYYGTVIENIQGPESPAIFMTWSEAIVFCNWLSERMGLGLAYHITGKIDPELRGGIDVRWIRGTNGYRLVTEAEWEYVMYEKGSSREELIKIYGEAFSQAQKKPLPYAQSGQLTSFDIISYPNFGITEMTWDEYGNFSVEPQKDPTGFSGLDSRGDRKVRRYFINNILFNRLSIRISGGEGEFIGIRLAQDRL